MNHLKKNTNMQLYKNATLKLSLGYPMKKIIIKNKHLNKKFVKYTFIEQISAFKYKIVLNMHLRAYTSYEKKSSI